MSLLEDAVHSEPASHGDYVTTSEAADLCNVTRFTIRNWILDNKLKASQTAGHHHRILRADLLKFMKETGIQPAFRTQKVTGLLNCWEFRSLTKADGHDCAKCLVFKTQANRCFLTVRQFGSEKVRCIEDCSKCAYIETFFANDKTVRDAVQVRSNHRVLAAAKVEKVEPLKGSNLFADGIQKSGHYVAAVKNIFSNIKIKKAKKFNLF